MIVFGAGMGVFMLLFTVGYGYYLAVKSVVELFKKLREKKR